MYTYCFSLAIRNGGAGKELPGPVAAALKLGIRNPKTETESWKQKRNTESNINDRKLKDFTLHNLVQSKENLL